MNRLAEAIEHWNAFAPTMPVVLDIDPVWVVVAFAAIALLVLGITASGRRLVRLAVARVAQPAPRRLGRTLYPRSRAGQPNRHSIRPRAPTNRPGVAALA